MIQRNDKKRQPSRYRHAFKCSVTAVRVASVIAALSMHSGAHAQTQLTPPKPLVQNAALPTTNGTTTPLSAPAASALSAPTTKPLTAAAADTKNLPKLRMQNLNIGGKIVDLRNLPDAHVLTASNGRTITIARIKQLQARMDSASTLPLIIAKPGQSLKTLAAAPKESRVTLVGGQTTSVAMLGKIEQLQIKLRTNRVVKPVPLSLPNVVAQGVVGQNNLTINEALKRPANEVIQISIHKYTAENLRKMDALLKANPRDPRGIAERMGKPTANASTAGPALKVTRGESLQQLLNKPDNTLLESSNGQKVTVAQIKQYLAKERMTPAQLETKFKAVK